MLIPEWGFEKRVHCDQLPLKKAEFDKNKRLLELYWEKGVPSSAYVPEDERPKQNTGRGGAAAAAAAALPGAAAEAAGAAGEAGAAPPAAAAGATAGAVSTVLAIGSLIVTGLWE